MGCRGVSSAGRRLVFKMMRTWKDKTLKSNWRSKPGQRLGGSGWVQAEGREGVTMGMDGGRDRVERWGKVVECVASGKVDGRSG